MTFEEDLDDLRYRLKVLGHMRTVSKMNKFGKEVMAHRYQYYCLGKSLITDSEYDKLEDYALTFEENKYLDENVGSDDKNVYSYEIVNWFSKK
jgi:NAD-dependent DNA ligase